MTNIKSSLFILVSGGTWTVLVVSEGLVVVLSSEGIEENSVMWRVFVCGWGGTRPFRNVSSQVLGLVWYLVWSHCTDVYHEVKKFYSFRSHPGLWSHNITQEPRGVMIAGWLVGMIYILVTQSEVHRPDPSSTPSLEMQDLRSPPDLTGPESPGDL